MPRARVNSIHFWNLGTDHSVWCFPGWFLWNYLKLFETIRICGKFNCLLFSVILLNNKKMANTGQPQITESRLGGLENQGTRKLWRWAIVSTSFDDLKWISPVNEQYLGASKNRGKTPKMDSL